MAVLETDTPHSRTLIREHDRRLHQRVRMTRTQRGVSATV